MEIDLIVMLSGWIAFLGLAIYMLTEGKITWKMFMVFLNEIAEDPKAIGVLWKVHNDNKDELPGWLVKKLDIWFKEHGYPPEDEKKKKKSKKKGEKKKKAKAHDDEDAPDASEEEGDEEVTEEAEDGDDEGRRVGVEADGEGLRETSSEGSSDKAVNEDEERRKRIQAKLDAIRAGREKEGDDE